MEIRDLRDRHAGQPGFCLGTAPHLASLDLDCLRDHVTIGCNQLLVDAAQRRFNYICFQRNERFAPLRDQIADALDTIVVVPESVLEKNRGWDPPAEIRRRLVSIPCTFSTTGHAKSFSLDLTRQVYASNVLQIEVQLAVWMGCNPIYILGVDGSVENPDQPFYRPAPGGIDVEQARNYHFPELADWLAKTRQLLLGRGIRLINAAGDCSTLDVLPRMRLRAATGNPTIAVTSKTFCNDDYLVSELRRFYPNVLLNPSDGKLAGDELAAFLAEADGLILGTEPFSAEVIAQLPLMRYVSKYGVGLNNVDFDAARRAQIEVAYRKGVNSDSVGELVIALTIMMLRNIDDSIQGYRAGKWRKLPGRELAEMTVGIIGYGHVGKVVARKFAQLGVGRLLVNDLLEIDAEAPAEAVPQDYLIRESDIISLHISMTPQNLHLVNQSFLARMKPGGYLLNTSRGEVVDEAALAAALHANRLAGAAIDVYEDEPVPSPELGATPHLLTTCHIAGSSNRAIKNMGWAAIEELLRLFGKEPE